MGSGADAFDSGAVGAGNKANGVGGVRGVGCVSGVSDAAGVGAGDTTSGVGGDAASFVPKTNSSIALPSGLRFKAFMLTLP